MGRKGSERNGSGVDLTQSGGPKVFSLDSVTNRSRMSTRNIQCEPEVNLTLLDE